MQFTDGLTASLTHLVLADGAGQASGDGEDNLVVGRVNSLADTLHGGAGNDVLSGMIGADALSVGDGDDILEGGAGAELLDGGAIREMGSAERVGDTVRSA